MVTRRTFSAMLAAGIFSSIAPNRGEARGVAEEQDSAVPKSTTVAKNVVLVHGAYADGSCWLDVIERLQSAGLNATAVQNPLTSLADDAAATRRILSLQDGPTVLVGHSWAGMVITEVGSDPIVSALVYVAARAPDAGEDYTALAAKFPKPPASSGLVTANGFAQLTEESFLRDFAPDLPLVKARGALCRTGSSCDHTFRFQDIRRRVESKTKLVCRLQAGPNDRSATAALHGRSNESNDD